MLCTLHYTDNMKNIAFQLGIDSTFSFIFSAKVRLGASDPRNKTKSKNYKIRKTEAKSSLNRTFYG